MRVPEPKIQNQNPDSRIPKHWVPKFAGRVRIKTHGKLNPDAKPIMSAEFFGKSFIKMSFGTGNWNI